MRADRRRRSGVFLLDLLVVMSVAPVLMMIAAGLIFQMLKIDAAERSRVSAASNLERLGRDLRGDAHASAGLADVRPDRLVLTRADGPSVEYTVGPRDVVRTATRAGKVEHRETYRLPSATAGRFESGRDGSRPLIAFTLAASPTARPDRTPDAGYRDFRIEAVASGGTR